MNIHISKYASGFQYGRVVKIPEFLICQGSEYIRVLNMPLVLSITGFSIYQNSEKTSFLKMPMLLNAPGLHRVPSMTEYV